MAIDGTAIYLQELQSPPTSNQQQESTVFLSLVKKFTHYYTTKPWTDGKLTLSYTSFFYRLRKTLTILQLDYVDPRYFDENLGLYGGFCKYVPAFSNLKHLSCHAIPLFNLDLSVLLKCAPHMEALDFSRATYETPNYQEIVSSATAHYSLKRLSILSYRNELDLNSLSYISGHLPNIENLKIESHNVVKGVKQEEEDQQVLLSE